jgi:hypothetical protein
MGCLGIDNASIPFFKFVFHNIPPFNSIDLMWFYILLIEIAFPLIAFN